MKANAKKIMIIKVLGLAFCAGFLFNANNLNAQKFVFGKPRPPRPEEKAFRFDFRNCRREDQKLHTSVKQGRYLEVLNLIEEPNADVNVFGKYKQTPLYYAAKKNLSGILSDLLENGADANGKNTLGTFPLYEALKRGNLMCVKILIPYTNKELIIEKDCLTIVKRAMEKSINVDNAMEYVDILQALERKLSEQN